MTPFIRIDRLLFVLPHLSSIRWILTGILLCGGLLLTPSDSPAKKPNKPAANPLELTEADRTFIELREASRKNDPARAQQLAASLPNYVFGDYVEYYKIKPQLFDAGGVARAETNADSQVIGFLNKYEGTALSDRMRNDWLLVLGKRKDWRAFDAEYPKFALDDDTSVSRRDSRQDGSRCPPRHVRPQVLWSGMSGVGAAFIECRSHYTR
jgi:soluble lytic murein transglycosylase